MDDEDFLDSLLSDLEENSDDNSSSSDTAHEKEINFQVRYEHVLKIGNDLIESFPKQPDINSKINKLLYHMYYSCHFAIIYNKLDGIDMKPNISSDTDNMLHEKAYYMFLHNQYNQFIKIVSELYERINGIIETKLLEKVEKKDVLVWFLNQIKLHKELHTRRVKIDPSTSRTKTTEVNVTYNAVTHQKYDSTNEDHKLWRMLIINPLPSDYDHNNVDPIEGDLGVSDENHKDDYKLSVKAYKKAGKYDIPDPFCIVVTPQWDKIYRIVHFLKHFEDYFFSYINTGIINEMENIKDLTIKDTWFHLLKEYSSFKENRDRECIVAVTVNGFSREKKTVPQLVFRIAVLRDIFKVLIKY